MKNVTLDEFIKDPSIGIREDSEEFKSPDLLWFDWFCDISRLESFQMEFWEQTHIEEERLMPFKHHLVCFKHSISMDGSDTFIMQLINPHTNEVDGGLTIKVMSDFFGGCELPADQTPVGILKRSFERNLENNNQL